VNQFKHTGSQVTEDFKYIHYIKGRILVAEVCLFKWRRELMYGNLSMLLKFQWWTV